MIALYPGKEIPPVVALAAYFDESKASGILTIAGYIGTVHDWDARFAPLWQQRVLQSAPHPISEYKTSDCRHGVHEFAGWTAEERNAVTVACVDTIVDDTQIPNIIGVGAAVVLSSAAEMGAVAAEGRRADLEGFAYCMCFWWVVEAALRLAERHLGSDQLELVFDDEHRLKHRARIVFDTGLESEEFAKFRGRVQEPTFRDSKKILPLQAADLLAYETYKEIRSRQETPQRRVSRALQRLVDGRAHVAHYCDGEMFKRITRRAQEAHPPATFDLPLIYEPGQVCR